MKIPSLNPTILPTTKKVVSQRNYDIGTLAPVKEILNNIYACIDDLGILIKLEPHQRTEPDAVASFLGIEALGIDTITNAIKNGFMALKNFFLKLKDAVVAFFKYLFDSNAKIRRALAAQVNKFSRANKSLTTANAPVVSLMPYSAFANTVQLLDKLYVESQAIYKADNKGAINVNCVALKAFGYNVEDNRVINTESSTEIPKVTKNFLSTDSDWGWTVQSLTTMTNAVLTLSSKAEKLNYIREKINNSVKSATYTIDRLNMVGKAEDAIKIQEKLNDVAIVSGFLFNCAAVFQRKIDYLSSQVYEAWVALNEIPG